MNARDDASLHQLHAAAGDGAAKGVRYATAHDNGVGHRNEAKEKYESGGLSPSRTQRGAGRNAAQKQVHGCLLRFPIGSGFVRSRTGLLTGAISKQAVAFQALFPIRAGQISGSLGLASLHKEPNKLSLLGYLECALHSCEGSGRSFTALPEHSIAVEKCAAVVLRQRKSYGRVP